jgi:hypothetical protein
VHQKISRHYHISSICLPVSLFAQFTSNLPRLVPPPPDLNLSRLVWHNRHFEHPARRPLIHAANPSHITLEPDICNSSIMTTLISLLAKNRPGQAWMPWPKWMESIAVVTN